MKVRVLLRQLHEDGWYLARQKGSHRQLKHRRSQGRSPSLAIQMMSSIRRRPEYPQASGVQAMTRRYLVLYENGPENSTGFAPDVPAAPVLATLSMRCEPICVNGLAESLTIELPVAEAISA
jgi:hypothetical protein